MGLILLDYPFRANNQHEMSVSEYSKGVLFSASGVPDNQPDYVGGPSIVPVG